MSFISNKEKGTVEMEGKFTFANAKEPAWEHELFDTFGQALRMGIEMFGEGVLVGQLKSDGTNYRIVNVYEFEEFSGDLESLQ